MKILKDHNSSIIWLLNINPKIFFIKFVSMSQSISNQLLLGFYQLKNVYCVYLNEMFRNKNKNQLKFYNLKRIKCINVS